MLLPMQENSGCRPGVWQNFCWRAVILTPSGKNLTRWSGTFDPPRHYIWGQQPLLREQAR